MVHADHIPEDTICASENDEPIDILVTHEVRSGTAPSSADAARPGGHCRHRRIAGAAPPGGAGIPRASDTATDTAIAVAAQ
ncbi:MAG: hypothetical protein AAGE76_08130 [Pseudomonadota bacterium]